MSDTPGSAGKSAFSPLRLVLTVAVVLAIGAAVYFAMVSQIEGAPDETERMRVAMGMGDRLTNRLGEGYTDADEDLVADTPEDPADQLDPAELTFSFIATDEPEAYAAVWQPLVAHLSQAVDRPVKYVPYDSRDAQLRDIRDGRLHLAGLNTGAVPVAVDACGFVPVCAPGSGGEALAYKMVVIVPKGSTKKGLKDLAGETIAFTEPTSNSGCKAALVMMEQAGLVLGKDYDFVFTHGHAQLMQDIATKKYVAGSTASDLLERAIQQGELEEGAVKIIYESEPFPAAALGISHRLKPDLAEKLRVALIGFSFVGTPLEQEYAASGADSLVPISYKDDFALIRRIDDAVGYNHQRVLKTPAPDEQEQDTDAGD